MTLRTEFEPLLISRFGVHFDAKSTAEAWDKERDEKQMQKEIARADEWLRLCVRTKTVRQKSASHSYHLKHVVERWYEQRYPRTNHYVANGCFLMAAHRLGFTIKHCSRDNPNAWLNISESRLPKGDGYK